MEKAIDGVASKLIFPTIFNFKPSRPNSVVPDRVSEWLSPLSGSETEKEPMMEPIGSFSLTVVPWERIVQGGTYEQLSYENAENDPFMQVM